MPPTVQILLTVAALCISVGGFICTLIALNRQKVTLVFEIKERVAVLETRMNGFSAVSEKWLASLLKAPTHYRLDTLLDRFTSQVRMSLEELEELETLLEESRYEPERFTGQKVAAGLMKAFVIQRKHLHYPPAQAEGEMNGESWIRRFWRWLCSA